MNLNPILSKIHLEDFLPFDWTVQFATAPKEFEIPEYCNSILVVNIGGVGGDLATVNNFPINATLIAGANGESWGIGGGIGEIVSMGRRTLEIGFPNGQNQARVVIVTKFYIIKNNC